MKYNILSILMIAIVLFSSCENELENKLNFDVNVIPAANIQIVDTVITAPKGTQIKFNFNGEPDFISFSYSLFNSTKSVLTFNAQPAWGTHIQNTLKVYLAETSDTLLLNNAKQDSINIANRQWVDISALCNLPTTANTNLKSSVSLNDYRGKKVVLAFRYKTEYAADWQPTWTISNLQINDTVISTNVKSASTIAAALSFKPFDMLNLSNPYQSADAAGVWNVANAASIVMKRTPSGNALNTDWLISKPILIPEGVTTLSNPVPVKNTTSSVESYTYQFANSGVYTVVFKASNWNYQFNESAVKRFKVIIPD